MNTVGIANTVSRASAGWMDINSATVTPSRRIHPPVENSDMYMWSSMNTWLRSTASRSRYSGRSWCAMVAMEASSRATCDSSAIVTLSRKRRCTRVLTVRRNHVAVADTPSATAAIWTRRQFAWSTPSPSSLNQSASSASGSAESSASENAATSRPGSCL